MRSTTRVGESVYSRELGWVYGAFLGTCLGWGCYGQTLVFNDVVRTMSAGHKGTLT